jgi:phytoene dehydrogenase-like protein
MGSISKAIASAAVAAGAHIVTDAEVHHQESLLALLVCNIS